MKFSRVFMLATVATVFSTLASAQDYPSKTVTILVPFAAGLLDRRIGGARTVGHAVRGSDRRSARRL